MRLLRAKKNVRTRGRSRGLGDTIAKITKAVGIQPCDACQRRREVFNRWVPYRQRGADAAVSDYRHTILPRGVSEAPTIWIPSENRLLVAPTECDISDEMIDRLDPPVCPALHDFTLGAHDDALPIQASTSWRDPGRRRGPADLEGDRRHWRDQEQTRRREAIGRQGTSMSGGSSGPTPASFACGLDVTSHMQASIVATRTAFGGWNADQKHEACQALRSLRTGAYAWDIIEMHAQVTSDRINAGFRPTCATSGATPACGSSVTVDGTCHFAGSANYVIFGVMCKLCHDYYTQQLNSASWYEIFDKDTYRQGVMSFSRAGMLGLIDLYKKYLPLISMDAPASNIDAAKNWSIAGYAGWPNGASTPSPDRANCTTTCPHNASAVMAGFTVSWYPHLNAYSR